VQAQLSSEHRPYLCPSLHISNFRISLSSQRCGSGLFALNAARLS
jgi:hypothetical protein